MRQFLLLFIICLTLLLPLGCASDGSFVNPFESSEPSTGAAYFFSEFTDVPIPNDMKESRGDTYISFAATGVKCGVQLFKGNLDIVALMNAMRRNLSEQGWVLRALLRSQESMLVFEKPDRICAIQITDGSISTHMRIFMSSKLEGDSHNLETPMHGKQPSAVGVD